MVDGSQTEPMKKPIRILHLEDNGNDVELIRRSLESDHLDCEILHVKGKDDFENAVLHDAYAAFLGLGDIDQHFLFHAVIPVR